MNELNTTKLQMALEVIVNKKGGEMKILPGYDGTHLYQFKLENREALLDTINKRCVGKERREINGQDLCVEHHINPDFKFQMLDFGRWFNGEPSDCGRYIDMHYEQYERQLNSQA